MQEDEVDYSIDIFYLPFIAIFQTYMTLSKIRVTKKSQFSFYKSLGGSDGLQKLFNIPKSSLELNNYEFVRKKMVSRM